MAKFLLVIPQHNGESNFKAGGQVTAATGLLEELRNSGHEVDVLNVIPSNFTTASKVSKVFNSLYRIVKAGSMLMKREYDYAIVFAGSIFSLIERLLIASIARMRSVKTAIFLRNSRILDIEPTGIRSICIRYFFLIPSLVCVQGKVWQNFFETMGVPSERIAVIPNWLPKNIIVAKTIKKVPMQKKISFVFVSRLIKDKGIFELADAVRELAEYYDFHMRVVGDGPEMDALRSRAPELVEFMGWQDRSNILNILEDSHVFLLPSYSEGFPNAMLEAMALGLPIVATDVGAISESLKGNGRLLTPKSRSELIEAMKQYIEKPYLVAEHSARSLDIVRERHDRTRNCQSIIELLNKGER